VICGWRDVWGLSVVPVFVVPGDRTTCLVIGYGWTCVSTEGAVAGQLLSESFAARSGPEVITGLVPDGVGRVTFKLVGGTTETVAVHLNVYRAHLTRRARTMTFTSALRTVSVTL